MEKITKYLNVPENGEIKIVPFGDVHLGNSNCREDKFRKLIKWVETKKDTYLIGMGDLIDCILPKDKRFSPDGLKPYQTVDDLKDEITEILHPVKDKIICMLQGNHENHMEVDGYGCPVKKICKELGVKYGGFSTFVKLIPKPDTKQRSLTLWLHHGWFAGRKRGAKVNNLEDNLAYYDADVYLAGHSHDLWATRKSRIYWSGSRDVTFGNTGTFLETSTRGTTSYSERANYPPLKLGVLKLTWLPREEKVYISE